MSVLRQQAVSAYGLSMNVQPLHRLPNRNIAISHTIFIVNMIPNLTITHGWMMIVNIGYQVIQPVLRLFVTVRFTLSCNPFIISASGNNVDSTQFSDRVLIGLLLNLTIDLLNHFLGQPPPFRSFCFFRRATSASFLRRSLLSSSIWYCSCSS